MPALFGSFFLAGFECSTGVNRHGEWFDQVAATQHDQFLDLDYELLRAVGIRGAREGVRWPLVDGGGGRYDFSTLLPIAEAAQRHGIDVIYDLFHYGYPAGLDLLSAEFPRRFADYAYATTRALVAAGDPAPALTPVNEPSYFSWAAGEAALFAPHWHGRGWELKVALARAAIAATDAIWAACPRARIVSVDALCRVVAPLGDPARVAEAEHFNTAVVFESWDMLAGRLLPELGGSRRHLGVVGANYYWTNQWELGRVGVPLADDDPRRWPLRRLIGQVWERYGGDVLISETSHVGDMRPVWLRELAGEAEALLDAGVPLGGVCLYPILGMPEWHARDEWTRMGLWDLVPQSPTLARIPYEPALAALREAQHLEARVR